MPAVVNLKGVRFPSFSASDGEALAEILADPALRSSLYPCVLRPPTVDQAIEDWGEPLTGPGDFQSVVRLGNDRVAGCVRLESWELSFFIGREYWGHGLGARALSIVMKEDRRPWCGKIISAATERSNAASIRTLERVGFTFSGMIPRPSACRCLLSYTYKVPWLRGEH